MEKNKLGGASSLIVSLPAVLLWLILGLVCAAFSLSLLSGIFLFLFLLCAAARYWGARAMEGLSMELGCERLRLYPGMSTELDYTLKNNKLLPLIWLELSQNAPERDCMSPDESFEQYEYIPLEDSDESRIRSWRRSFSLVMPYETLSVSTAWQANRRGLYKPDFLLLRSGDGFGLTQVERRFPADRLPEFVVYPRNVPVDVSMFLQNDWEHVVGSAGFAEDISILRGTRPYQAGDSWKRINWRLAAREPGQIKVNFYETVQPRTVMFILDGESFCGFEDDFSLLEESLEVLGSVINALFEKGVCCGLCLPSSRRFPSLALPPTMERSAAELLYYLAGYDCKNIEVRDKEGRHTGRYKGSAYERGGLLAAVRQSGLAVLITARPDAVSAGMLSIFEGTQLRVFSAHDTKAKDPELKVLPLDALRKGAVR